MELIVIQKKIYEIRWHKVMLDFDLAELYEIETKNINVAVKRNNIRFPSDFMFQLTKEEWESLRLQNETSEKKGGRRYLPNVFTGHGVAMHASVLKSEKAALMNIAIVRAFVFMRNYALSHKDLTEKLHELESKYNRQ